jgi:hypothetical protein
MAKSTDILMNARPRPPEHRRKPRKDIRRARTREGETSSKENAAGKHPLISSRAVDDVGLLWRPPIRPGVGPYSAGGGIFDDRPLRQIG